MDKTSARRQLFAAVSVLGVSLGMADVAHAAKDDVISTQNSHKGQHSLKITTGEMSSHKHQSSIKGQHSLKIDGRVSQKVSSYNSPQ